MSGRGYGFAGIVAALGLVITLGACGGSGSPVPSPQQPHEQPGSTGDSSHAAASGDTAPPPPSVVVVTMQPQPVIAPAFASAFPAPAPGGSPLASTGLDISALQFDTAAPPQQVTASDGFVIFAPATTAGTTQTGLAFATYRLHLGGYASPGQSQTLGLTWDADRLPDTAQLWVGLANWSRGSWDWYAGPDDDVLTLASFAPYTDLQGDAAVLVVLAGTQPAALERLTVGAPELRGMGALPSGRTASAVMPATAVKAASSLPGSFDLSAACSPISNQGSIGSCTAFAVGNGAMNYEMKRIYGNVGWDYADDYNLVSQKYLYGETGLAQGLGCPNDGRYLGGCVSFLSTQGEGIAAYHNAPYTNVCDYIWSSEALADAAVLHTSGFEYIPTGTPACLDVMKTMLAVYERPVIIGLGIDNAFMSLGSNAVWNYTGPQVGGHAVLVVGYDDTKSAFKIRNSWGTGWAGGGHGWIGYTTFSTNTGTWIEAYDMWAEYDPAVQERFFPDASLIPPTNVAASDGTFDTQVRVTWDSAANATDYKVFRATASNGVYSQVGTSASTQFDDTTVPDTNVYWYRIASSNAGGDSSQSPSEGGNLRLTAPTGLAASDGTYTDHVRVSWNSVPNAATYKVYRSATQTGTYSLVSAPGATHYDDPQATLAVYWYKVTADNVSGESDLSTADSGNAGLAAPTGVAASDGTFTDHVNITWTAVAGATSYKVFRAGTQFGTYTLVGSPTTATYNDAVTVSTPLWYQVKATNASGDSLASTADPGNSELSAPVNFGATDGTHTDHVHLSWQGGGAPTFKVYRAVTQNGIYSQIGTSSMTQYDDYVGTTSQYWYKVRAYNANGDGQPTGTNAGNASLATPAGLDASDGAFRDHVHLGWNAVPGATGYNVYRASSQTGSYALLTSVTSTQHDDFTPLSYKYWYKVKASNASGLSIYSTANAGNAGQAAPLSVAATNGSYTDHVRVDWKAAPDATGYKVFRSTAQLGTYAEIGATTALLWNDPQAVTTQFWYKVKSTGPAGDSWFSTAVPGRVSLPAPVGVLATDGTHADHVHLSWGGVVNATTYKVYRGATEAGPYQLIATLAGRQYDELLPVTYRYWYRVKASNSNGDSQSSTADLGYVGVAAPTNVQATDGTLSAKIRITWNAVPGATKYKLYRWTGSAWAAIAGLTTTQYDDNVADQNTRYYRVCAVGAVGTSMPSLYDTGFAGP